jgi:hypothetical protein
VTVDPPPARSALILALQRKHVRAAPRDLADLALLRRNLPRLSTGADPRTIALITAHCGVTRDAQNAGLLTACLWAARHRVAAPVDSTWNLGRSLREVPAAAGGRAWRNLSRANSATLPRYMTDLVEVFAHHEVATDWHRLHRDLRSWYQGLQHAVLGRWSAGFFSRVPSAALLDTPRGAGPGVIGLPAARPARTAAHPEIPRPARPSELSS